MGNYGQFDFAVTDGKKDIVYATAQHATADPATRTDPVQLQFNHALCRVKLTITDGMPDNYTIEVNNIQIKGTPQQGTFALAAGSTGSWTPATPWAEYVANYDDLGRIQTSGATDYQYMIPAVQQDKIYLSFDVVLSQVDQAGSYQQHVYQHRDKTVNVAGGLGKGLSYNIAGTITAANIDPEKQLYPISFTVDVTPYGDDVPLTY